MCVYRAFELDPFQGHRLYLVFVEESVVAARGSGCLGPHHQHHRLQSLDVPLLRLRVVVVLLRKKRQETPLLFSLDE